MVWHGSSFHWVLFHCGQIIFPYGNKSSTFLLRLDFLDFSVRKAKTDDGEDRLDPVFPGDLLPLLVAAAVVGNADFVDPQPGAQLGDLRGDFGFEAEAIALDRRDPIQDIL